MELGRPLPALSALRRRVERRGSLRTVGLGLLLWGVFKLLVGMANYGSAGSWLYFDVWAMLVGAVVIVGGGSLVTGIRGRHLTGAVAAGLLLADRLYALVLLPGASDVLVGIQVLLAAALGGRVLAERRT